MTERSDKEHVQTPHTKYAENYAYAQRLWELLVKNVGESDAKAMMRQVMGHKKPGPAETDEHIAINYFISLHLRHCGKALSDGKIAYVISVSKPHFLKFESGAIFLVNDVFKEECFDTSYDPIVDRWPFAMQYQALKKRVERVRRWCIDVGMLPKDYAPKSYSRE